MNEQKIKKGKLIKKVTAVALTAVGVTSLSFGVAGCAKKSIDTTEPDNVEVWRLAPPDDGSLPTAHTCAENLAYINYVFDHQEQYHSYSYGVTNASITTQSTRTFRDFKDGVLITTDLTYSSVVKSGSQTCTVVNDEGDYEVYFRTSETPGADTLPAEAVWSEEAPLIFNERTYHYTYGLLPNELFNYIINEDNVVSSEQIKANPDGTYTQSFILDPVASTYFYQFGMKTRGGLSGFPEFNNISFSVTFDGDWQIITSVVHEVATINKGIVLTSISDFTTDYWYGEEKFDQAHHDFYKSYFSKYLGDDELEHGGSVDDEMVIDVTNVLSNGFSQILNGGQQFEISVDLGNNSYLGYLFLTLDLSDPLETLVLKASLGKTLKEQTLYIEYGNGGLSAYYGQDFALGANLTEVKLAVEKFGGLIDKLKSVFGGLAGNGKAVTEETAEAQTETDGEESDALAELLKCMTLEYGEKQAVLTLDTDDLLGMGIGINARLVFGLSNRNIFFRGGTVNELSLGGKKLDLGLSIRTTTVPEISRDKTDAEADLADYVADIYSLLNSDLLKVNLKLDGSEENVSIEALKNLSANVEAYVDIDGVTVGADIDLAYSLYGKKISAKLSVWYGYDPAEDNYGLAVVRLTEFNGAEYNVNIKCDIKSVIDAVSTAITLAGSDNGATSKSLVEVVNGVLSQDFSKLITGLYADKAQIKAGVNVDAIVQMFGINAGFKFGTCNLCYAKGEEVYGGVLSAKLPALGFELSVSGASGNIGQPDLDECLDVLYLVDDVKKFIDADLIEAKVTLSGDGLGVTLKELEGLNAEVTALIDAHGLTVGVEAYVSYQYKESDAVSAKLSAWYGEKGENDLGKIALSLTEINGVAVNANVACDVSELTAAIEALLKLAGAQANPFDLQGAIDIDLQQILTDILQADIKVLLPKLATDNDGLRIALNVDEALKLFKVDLKKPFGNADFVYSHSGDRTVTASVPALGLSAGVAAASGKIEKPDLKEYLNLTDLIKTVNSVWEQVDGIIEQKAVAFSIVGGQTYLKLDGITVEICGDGEVCWEKGRETVALDLEFSITERATDKAAFKLIYNKNATDTPLVRLALNEVGIDIYKEDIDGVVNGFKEILEKVSVLTGGNSSDSDDIKADGGKTENGKDENGAAQISGKKENVFEKLTANDNLMALIFKVLSSGDWVEELNNLTLSTDGKGVILSYLSDNAASVEVKTEGDIQLFYDGEIGGRFCLGGGVVASSVSGSLISSLNQKFASLDMKSSKQEGSAGFMRLAYDFLFEGISNLSVSNILGGDTYTVTFALNGANTNVEELQDVFIDAKIYVTGAKDDHGKLTEIDLNIDAAGIVIELNVITERVGNSTRFYIDLKRVMEINLPDLKFYATQESLYDTIKVALSAINNTNLLDMVGELLGNGADKLPEDNADKTENGGQSGGEIIEEDKIDAVCALVEKLLNFNFSQAVVATESKVVAEDGSEEEILNAVIDLDNILKQLGIKAGTMGTVEVNINHTTHAMTTEGQTDKADADGVINRLTWISLSSELVKVPRDYSKLDKSEYISIEFLPTLIDDLISFATDDNGNVYNKFTLNGSISARLLVNLGLLKIDKTIDVDVKSLTVGLTEKDGLYISAVLRFHAVSIVNIKIPDTTVGLTYKNGMLTLVKNLDSKPEYRVMTFDYFIDHLLTKENSSLQWWLDIGGWNTISSLLDSLGMSDLASGANNAQSIYMYKQVKNSGESQEISMKDYVEAIRIVTGGSTVTDFISSGEYANVMNELEKEFGLVDASGAAKDYYGFSLNASKATGGVLNKLFAAITRNESGLTGVKASGSIKYSPLTVTFAAGLNYNEGLTEEYELDTAVTENKAAPDMYAPAMAIVDASGIEYDFDHFKSVVNGNSKYDELFGCLKVEASGDGYTVTQEYTHALYSYNLTVVREGEENEVIKVRDTSMVYLYNDNSPVYTDDTKTTRILYSTEPDAVGATEVQINGADLTIYAVYRRAVDVVVHNGSDLITINLYEGAAVPTSVEGLSTIVIPSYDEQGNNPVKEGDKIGAGIDKLNLYGVFVQSEVEINSVKYVFSAEGGFHYIAAGKTGTFNDTYSVKGETLILENEIGGYPVTEIAANAFANTEATDDSKGKPVKNVIVPQNIVTVGEGAFKDNFGMQSAVFLADRVTFAGGAGEKDENQPFYGCSTEIGGTSTALSVYYNIINFCGSDSNIYWTKFRIQEKSLGIYYRYYIGVDPVTSGIWAGNDNNGGGSLHGNGSWEYAKIVLQNNTEPDLADGLAEEYLTNGLHLGTNNAAAAQAAMQEALNDYSVSAFGTVEKYTVTVTAHKDGEGYTQYTVTVEFGEEKYPVTLLQPDNATLAVAGEKLVEFKGVTYACGEIAVECKDIEYGYSLVGITANGTALQGNPVKVAVNGEVTVSATLKANLIEIKLISAVAFNYGGKQLSAGGATVTAGIADGEISLSKPEAQGYVFLGWAQDIAGSMQFIGSRTQGVDGAEYYAVWGTSEIGTDLGAQVNTSGSAISAPANGNGKWYDGNWNVVTQVSKANTVVQAKAYTINYSISGNFKMNVSDTLKGVDKQTTKSYSGSFKVLEGQTVSAVRTEGKKVEIYVDGQIRTTLTLAKYSLNNYDFKSNDGSLKNGEYTQKVEGDCQLNLKY